MGKIQKITVGISLGDINGIGIEVILKTFALLWYGTLRRPSASIATVAFFSLAVCVAPLFRSPKLMCASRSLRPLSTGTGAYSRSHLCPRSRCLAAPYDEEVMHVARCMVTPMHSLCVCLCVRAVVCPPNSFSMVLAPTERLQVVS